LAHTHQYFFIRTWALIEFIYNDTFGLFEGVNASAITIQREQYEGTVHLFIGTGRSPGKSTFMTLTLIYDRNINH
jgi:hypothetical protein